MPLIQESVAADAAFQLLASSTIKRYLRVAREIAERAGLIAAIRETAETASHALDRARALWNAVNGANTRIPEEFELALLLVALIDGQYEPAEALLLQIASSPDALAPWSIALAKRLRQLGPPLKAEQEQLVRELNTVLATTTAEPCSDDPRLRIEVQQ
jgi:hypothetical protein